MNAMSNDKITKTDKLSSVEHMKLESNGLRGTITETIADTSQTKFSDTDEQLTKFHGFYQGYNRDTATARKKQKLDKEWELMLRAKIPAGHITAKQYLALDQLADKFSNGTLRVTSRQGLQFHNVMKGDISALIKEINETMLTTLGGCGDVVRNIMAVPSPIKSPLHDEIRAAAYAINDATLPTTSGYYDMWVDGKKQAPLSPTPDASGTSGAIDPLYGDKWLPRKFKIAIATPEDNTVDALSNDIGLIALHENGTLHGYNIYIGGGFGMKHNNDATYPRIASPLGYVPKDKIISATRAIIIFQRDHGDRTDRGHARLKYVVEENGIEFCKKHIEKLFGETIAPLHKMPPLKIHDHLGWQEQGDGKWALGIPVTSGRIKDTPNHPLRSALREIVTQHDTPLILMPTEDVIICDIEESAKTTITNHLKTHNIALKEDHLPVELWAMSCVALPTCGKALTEGERARVPIITTITNTLKKHGLEQEKIAVRITGCPNGCSRPYLGDIGIVGRAPDLYAIYIGGDFEGTRLNQKIADMVHIDKIGDFLEPFFETFKSNRANENQGLGDFCHSLDKEKLKELAAQSGAAKRL